MKADRGKKSIRLKSDAGGELCRFPGSPERQRNESWIKSSLNPGCKNVQTEAVVVWTYHEKPGFSGKGNIVGKG